ncbi:MAG TPA: energy transducer TonB [Rudaea sp.]
MAARSTPPSNSSSNLVKIVSVVVILAAIGAGAYFYLHSGSSGPAPAAPTAASTAAPNAAAPAATAAAPAQPVPDLTPEQLQKEGSAALRDNRLVAPAGNNAAEYYLSLLEKQPNNATAHDALREMFPMAVGSIEQAVNAGNLDEATREINLLAKADPNNYTLTILRSKLDARKKTLDREEAQKEAAQKAADAQRAAATAAAANPAAPTTPATDSAGTPPAAANNTAANRTTPAANNAATNAANGAPAVASATPAPAPASAAPVAGGESHPAEMVKSSAPEYPPDAARKRQEGWVEVEFTVTPDGGVADVNVVNANPQRVFNNAAIRAVQRWSFKPKMDNGKAVEERMRRRIEFKLGG